MKTNKEYIAENQALWDTKTDIHVASQFYDVEGFLAGQNSLRHIELGLLPDVAGKSILHLQCHFGLDTMSWNRLGAKATGVDFSPNAIEQAKSINKQAGLDARFVQSDVLELDLDEQFDIVFTSYGVLGWLPDLKRWSEVVNKHLKPGGTLCIVESHSVMYLFNEKGEFFYPYFGGKGPDTEMTSQTYTDGPKHESLPENFWIHTQEEIIQTVIDAGLSLNYIKAYPYFPYPAFNMEKVGEEQHVFNSQQGRIPYTYSILATK
ncbi:MAG: class I SAM-dependent methyltransferase [Bacteroidia bacterium]